MQKVVERIFEQRIQQQIEIGDMQFGFMKGKGTTDAFSWQHRCRRILELKVSSFGFVDLKKAFDRVPREVISWAMHKMGVEVGKYRQ